MRWGLLAVLGACGDGPERDRRAGDDPAPDTQVFSTTDVLWTRPQAPDPTHQLFQLTRFPLDVEAAAEAEQHHASAVMHADGSMLALWDQHAPLQGGHARRFSAVGTPLDVTHHVTLSGPGPSRPVAIEADGGHLMVWNDRVDVFLSLLDGQGVWIPPAVLVSQTPGTDPDERHGYPAIAHIGVGTVVVWEQGFDAAVRSRTYVRRFGHDHAPLGNEVQIGQAERGSPPDVAPLPDGGFAVAWVEVDVDGEASLFLGLHDANGVARSDPLVLDTGRPGTAPGRPSVSSSPDGLVVVAWKEINPDADTTRSGFNVVDPAGPTVRFDPPIPIGVIQNQATRPHGSVAGDHLFVTWRDGDPPRVLLDVFDIHTGVSVVDPPSTAAPGVERTSQSYVDAVLDPDGGTRAVVTWQQPNPDAPDRSEVHAALYRLEPITTP